VKTVFMKIAVANEGGFVSPHFGRCAEYTLFTVNARNEIMEKAVIPNPGHEPGFLPGYLAKLGVTHIIAGGMGQRAQNLFAQEGIVTLMGATGSVDEVVQDFLNGSYVEGESLCEHGLFPHQGCEHGHHHEE
jgi:predicted Fe-Mo cluster-binding NifX family protein